MTTVEFPIALIATFLWIGAVCSISFMEAWLKFRAPGVTLPIGLGIGRLVFSALNKMEWVFALVIAGNLLFVIDSLVSLQSLIYFCSLISLILQSTWLLSSLDSRAEKLIKGYKVPPSNLHVYYVILEISKVICLSVFGLNQFNTITV